MNVPLLRLLAVFVSLMALASTAVHDPAVNRRFVRDFQTLEPGHDPEAATQQAYDTASVIYRLVAAQHGNVDPDRAIDEMRGMRFESPRGPILIDPKTRDCVQNVDVRRVVKRDGKLVNEEFETLPAVQP